MTSIITKIVRTGRLRPEGKGFLGLRGVYLTQVRVPKWAARARAMGRDDIAFVLEKHAKKVMVGDSDVSLETLEADLNRARKALIQDLLWVDEEDEDEGA